MIGPVTKPEVSEEWKAAAVVAKKLLAHYGPDGLDRFTWNEPGSFQQLHHLTATGVTDPATWAALRGAPVAAPPTPPATVVLRLGSTGPAVVALQQRLRLAASGRFDAATRAAVIAFQAVHRLSPDGVVGPLTQAALRAA